MPVNVYEMTPKDGGSMNSGCSVSGGRSTIRYFIVDQLYYPRLNTPAGPPSVNVADLANLWKIVLGETMLTDDTPTKVSMQRSVPAVHPMFPWMIATSINDLSGRGKFTMTNAYTPSGFSGTNRQPFTSFASYKTYVMAVEFTPPPYAVFSDNLVTETLDNWTYFDGSQVSYKASNDYQRFSWFELDPQFNFVTLSQGASYFNDTFYDGNPAHTVNGAIAPQVNTSVFTGSIRKFMPDTLLRFFWLNVPLRYVTSDRSYLRRFIGTVNQFHFELPGTDDISEGIPPGQLLYLAYKPKPFTPPVPKVIDFNGQGIFSSEKLCNLELNFLLTYRNPPIVSIQGNPNFSTAPVPINPNWVASGHNLQPSQLTNLFHYVQFQPRGASISPSLRKPYWYSVPFDLLFADPDYPQPGGGGAAAPMGDYPTWQAQTINASS